jgi:lsr operon transcriptional repressor
MVDDIEGWRAEEQLLRAAWYYYKDERTQDEIARRMSVSRASVGRMLDRARKVGLVTITLTADHLSSFDVASQLCETFGLSEALVVPDFGGEPIGQRDINARLGLGAADYLTSHLRPGGSVGVGWGDTVSRVIAAADLSTVGRMTMVTLTGGVDGYLQALAYSRGDRDALTANVIPSPIVASTPKLAAALRAEPTIKQVIQSARELQLAIVGVGTAAADSTLVQMGYLSASEARAWTKKGLVGDILGQFFDLDGKVLDLPIHSRRIGVDLSDLRAIDKVVGVAGGLPKVDAILGALHGGYLDVLITNEAVAIELIKRAR